MNTSASGKPVFKPYEPNQPTFLPPSVSELIPDDHLVRVVSEMIDRLDITPLVKDYPGGGASAYHPKMLLKVIVYGYTQGVYTSRRIARACRENICYMWLAGGLHPDFRTIARFRSSRLKRAIEETFTALNELYRQQEQIDDGVVFVDGTKLEANANKRTAMWKKSLARYRRLRQEKIQALLAQIDELEAEEMGLESEQDLEQKADRGKVTSERVAAKVAELEQRLGSREEESGPQEQARTKQEKEILKQIEQKELPKLAHYERQEEVLGSRNSASRTDSDATFMRMKEDPLQGGELKAGYNVQISTENQMIVGFSVHQRPGDSPLLQPHLEKVKQQGGSPAVVVADAGYGSEENYAYLEEAGIEAYVKYIGFHQQQKRSYQRDPFQVGNWPYDEQQDSYRCPEGKHLTYVSDKRVRSEMGYESVRKLYQADSCAGCPFTERCIPRGGKVKQIQVGEQLERYRARARALLQSDVGKKLRARRSIEVESVFGQIKGSRAYRRFLLRGLDKVTVEVGLLAIAHNLIKVWRRRLAAAFWAFWWPQWVPQPLPGV